jgi:hypothetical protein
MEEVFVDGFHPFPLPIHIFLKGNLLPVGQRFVPAVFHHHGQLLRFFRIGVLKQRKGDVLGDGPGGNRLLGDLLNGDHRPGHGACGVIQRIGGAAGKQGQAQQGGKDCVEQMISIFHGASPPLFFHSFIRRRRRAKSSWCFENFFRGREAGPHSKPLRDFSRSGRFAVSILQQMELP